MFTSLFSVKPIESCGKFPQPQYTLNRLKSPDDFLRNLTVLHFHSEKVSDTVVNRVLRLNFKAGIDNFAFVRLGRVFTRFGVQGIFCGCFGRGESLLSYFFFLL